MHHLTREATPGALHDIDGQAFARSGVQFRLMLSGLVPGDG
jgi:hypothetical protein